MRRARSIFLLILFASLYIDTCRGKGGGKKKEFKSLASGAGAGTDGAINDYSEVGIFIDNPQEDIVHKKLKSTNSSKSTTSKSHNRILIGGFNTKKFGIQKINKKQDVLDAIVRIVMRYDLIALTEVTDRKEQAIINLMAAVNQKSRHHYQFVLSRRVGRADNKEQYAVIYRSQKIQVKGHKLYSNSSRNAFTRDPLIVQLSFKGRAEEVGLVVIRVKPSEAVKEINALVDVQDWIENNLKIKDVIIIGDFHADCSYVRKEDWPSINLRNQDRFLWLIGDEVDTTVEGTKCAYDRIVISGVYLRSSVIPKSSRPYKFDRALELDDKMALQVSDHYPVEFAFRLNVSSPSAVSNKGFSTSPTSNRIHSQSLFFFSLLIVGSVPALWHHPIFCHDAY